MIKATGCHITQTLRKQRKLVTFPVGFPTMFVENWQGRAGKTDLFFISKSHKEKISIVKG